TNARTEISSVRSRRAPLASLTTRTPRTERPSTQASVSPVVSQQGSDRRRLVARLLGVTGLAQRPYIRCSDTATSTALGHSGRMPSRSPSEPTVLRAYRPVSDPGGVALPVEQQGVFEGVGKRQPARLDDV